MYDSVSSGIVFDTASYNGTYLKLTMLSTDADVYSAWLRYFPRGALVGEHLSSMMSKNDSVDCDGVLRCQRIASLP